jgi:dGTPase
MQDIIQSAQEHSKLIEQKILSSLATKSQDAIRKFPEKIGIRPNFFRDTDRILHSRSFTRYIDKTQVFYLFENDDITHRVLHVQLVSKIARSIGRSLGLNEDLIEAIALGHDLGHPPFGHEGEEYLDKICCKRGIGHFVHSVQSVIFLDKVEKRMQTKPLNLSLQVLDGILCHDGEIINDYLTPHRLKNWRTHFQEIKNKTRDKKFPLIPMTMEGCVVRYSDVIAYIGRDIEDAISVNLISRKELPKDCTKILGNNNRNIINVLVTDLIKTSKKYDNRICYSWTVNKALMKLRAFNYKMIYLNKRIKTESVKIERLFNFLFDEFLNDIKKHNVESEIYRNWINIIDAEYISSCSHPEIVRDFISSLTDDYFVGLFRRKYFPQSFGIRFTKKERHNVKKSTSS